MKKLFLFSLLLALLSFCSASTVRSMATGSIIDHTDATLVATSINNIITSENSAARLSSPAYNAGETIIPELGPVYTSLTQSGVTVHFKMWKGDLRDMDIRYDAANTAAATDARRIMIATLTVAGMTENEITELLSTPIDQKDNDYLYSITSTAAQRGIMVNIEEKDANSRFRISAVTL